MKEMLPLIEFSNFPSSICFLPFGAKRIYHCRNRLSTRVFASQLWQREVELKKLNPLCSYFHTWDAIIISIIDNVHVD